MTIAFGIRNVDDIAARVRGDVSRAEAGRPPGDSRVRDADDAGDSRASYLLVLQSRAAAHRPRWSRATTPRTRYLPASVGAFASPDEFVKILRQAGFTEISASPLTFGIVYSLYGSERAR